MKKMIGILAAVMLILALCLVGTAGAEGGSLSVTGISEGDVVYTGHEVTVTTVYTAEDAAGVKLVRRVFKENVYPETVCYEKESSGNRAEDTFRLWEYGTCVLEVSAVRGEETLCTKEIRFRVDYTEDDYDLRPDFPEYLYIEGESAVCRLTLDYTGHSEPEEADVQVEKNYRTYKKYTGMLPGETIEFEASAGDSIGIRVASHKTDYYTCSDYYSIKIVNGKLEKPQAEKPPQVQPGESFAITITGVPENATGLYIRVTELDLENGWENYVCEAQPEAETGEVLLARYGLDPGSYRIRIQARARKYEPSDQLIADFDVIGERPAAPEVIPPQEELMEGDTAYFTVHADGMTAAECYSDTYQAENGTAVIPLQATCWTNVTRFIALVDGRWSEWTDEFSYRGAEKEQEPLHPAITVAGESTQGKDLWVGVDPVEGGRDYAVSLGRIVRYSSEEGEPIYDKILYEKEFDISDGGVLIHGCYLMEPGTYGVSINVYGNEGYNWLGSSVKEVTVREAAGSLPAAPTAELLTGDNLWHGMTKIRVNTGGGADKIYAFVKIQDSREVDTNPVEITIRPEDTSAVFERFNYWADPVDIRFSVSRNGVWSALSEPVSYTPVMLDYEPDDWRINFRVPEEEFLFGEPVTVTWDPVDGAEWYGLNQADELLPGTVTSFTIDTAKYGVPGRNNVEIYAYLPGQDLVYGRGEYVMLDPALRLTARVSQVNGKQVTLDLTGVAANRVRVRVNGEDRGNYGIRADHGAATLTLSVNDLSDWIQVANYDTNGIRWGTWSAPVSARVTGEKTLVLPEDLTRIEDSAFAGTDCEVVYIPDGCGTVGRGAFKGCEHLVYVSYRRGTTVAEDAFEGCSDNLVIEIR